MNKILFLLFLISSSLSFKSSSEILVDENVSVKIFRFDQSSSLDHESVFGTVFFYMATGNVKGVILCE